MRWLASWIGRHTFKLEQAVRLAKNGPFAMSSLQDPNMHSKATAFTKSLTEHLGGYSPGVKLAHPDLSPLLKHIGLTQMLRDNAYGRRRFVGLGTLLPDSAYIGTSLCEGLNQSVVVDAIASQYDVSTSRQAIVSEEWCNGVCLPIQRFNGDVGA